MQVNATQRKWWVVFLGILLLGLAIRIYRIWEVPMYGDELTMVYDTYSIVKTGSDSTGQKFPLTFKMGAGRPGGYIYFSTPFVAIFGPTVWGERSLSLLSGLGMIILIYFLGKKLLGEKVGLTASFLMAISPWDVYLSRAGYEAHFALFLALAGITAFTYKKYLLWAITWGIAALTYPTFKLTLPLIFVLLASLNDFSKLIKIKLFLVSLVTLGLFGIVALSQSFTANSEQRFLTQNIFSDYGVSQSVIQRVDNERTISTLPKVFKPIFINKQIEYGRMVFENYVKNISPEFLILRGDGNPRQNPGEMGMLFIIDLPLILISLTILWRENRRLFILLFGWVLITPIATMFFPEAHALRNDLMLPALVLLTSFALTKVPKKFAYVCIGLMFVQLIYILIRVYFIAPNKFASFWSTDAKKYALEAKQKAQEGQKIVLSTQKIDNIEYAYEVYAKVDPTLVQSQYGKLPKVFGNVVITD